MPNIDLEHVQRLCAFHHWATDKVLDPLAVATAEQLDRPWGGSFGTGRRLLHHVVGAERLWVDRWNGQSARKLPEYPASFVGRDFRAEWEKIKIEARRFVEKLTAKQLAGDLTYVNMKGEPWTYPLADILVHCVNHGTYHRGQLTQLLRDLGMSAPSTDYLVFVDEGRKR
jgi:uncharacterized damage-inducible protein DinB